MHLSPGREPHGRSVEVGHQGALEEAAAARNPGPQFTGGEEAESDTQPSPSKTYLFPLPLYNTAAQVLVKLKPAD